MNFAPVTKPMAEEKVLTTRTKMRILAALSPRNGLPKQSLDKTSEISTALQQCISTEDEHVKKLDVLLQKLEVLKSETGNLEEVYLTLNQLCNFHKNLLNQLERCRSQLADIGAVFLKYAPEFQVYIQWAKRWQEATIFMKQQAEFQTTKGADCASLNDLQNLSLNIDRYKCLLKSLVQLCPENTIIEKDMRAALLEISKISGEVTQFFGVQENIQKMLQLQKRLVDKQPRLIHPNRRFIKEGLLMKVNQKGDSSHERQFFLFSDMLMYCKPVQKSHLSNKPPSLQCCGILPLQQSIVEVLFGAGGKDATLFRVSAKEQMLMLYSKQPGESENWISALKQAIEELPDHKVLAKENSRPHLKRKPRLYGKRTKQPLSKKQAMQESTNETRRNPESSSCYRDLLVAGLCSGVNNE